MVNTKSELADSSPGNALGQAILGVEDIEKSEKFYSDVIGLRSSGILRWTDPSFSEHWRLPGGSDPRVALLTAGDSRVGAILLMNCPAEGRKMIRNDRERKFLGLFNLNFYVRDIHAAVESLKQNACAFWSDPVQYDLGPGVGSPIEVTVEGPDGMLYNLVELAGGDSSTRIGQMRAHLEEHGTTLSGFTEVVTTAHCVNSTRDALSFYQEVLGLEIIIDEVVDKDETNQLLSLPNGSRTHLTFLKGNHPFGKVVLMEPLNYDVPDFTLKARPPNVGYLAMGFPVADLDTARKACEDLNIEFFNGPTTLEIPGLGAAQALIIKTPGSGALTQLYSLV